MLLNLRSIRIDGGTQSRAELNNTTVEEYTEAMLEGAAFPPIVVFFDGASYWLADGFHRYFGADHAGLDEVEAQVRQGTQQDAQLFSFGVNASHGLRRTNADKRKAVTGALQHPVSGQWSDRQIAKHCGVSDKTVAAVRQSHCGNSAVTQQDRTYTTKHGTTAVMNTANIGKTDRPAFQRGAYRTKTALSSATTQPKKIMKNTANSVTHGYLLNPPGGTQAASTVPSSGIESAATVPPEGTVMGGFGDSSIPPGGNHLEKPSTDDRMEVAAATSAQQKTASTLHGKHDGGVADQGCYQRLRPNPERLFTGLPGLDAVVRPEAAAAPQREGGYQRLALKPKRLFTGLLLAEHQRAPEQVMQLAVQRAAQAARKAVAP